MSLWLSRLLLLGLLGGYLALWTESNWGMLFDPDLQNDDARTIIFPFHRYGEAGTLADDPIANEMLSAVPWGVRALYLAFVPLVDIYWASKLVQLVALGVLAWAGVVLAGSRRAGPAAGALLVFLILHTWYSTERIAGGLPRAFGFPCFALWLAGVTAQKRVPRFLAPVILSLSYPSIMNLILAAEGFLALRGAGRVSWGVIARRLRRYAVVVGVCFVCVLPAAMGSADRGPIHTLEQAKKEPAFGRSGRLYILPFAEPMKAIGEALIAPVRPHASRSENAWNEAVRREPELIGAVVLSLFLLVPLFRWAPMPASALSFFVGALIVYTASRILAFSLYSPERYYSFGMRMAGIAFVMAGASQIWFWSRGRYREVARNVTVFLVMGGIWLVSGDRLEKDTGMEIARERDAELYEFVRTLPKEARFATHILDGDGIPFWGARAHMGSYETLQPWFVDSWARQKDRAMATQDALYGTKREAVLKYAEERGVTHFLINRYRYGKGLKRHTRSFEPFSTHARKLVQARKKQKMLFEKPPKDAIVFQSKRFRVVSVEALRKLWSKAD